MAEGGERGERGVGGGGGGARGACALVGREAPLRPQVPGFKSSLPSCVGVVHNGCFFCKDLVAPPPPFHSPSNTPHPPTQIWLARSPHPPPAPPFQHKNAWGLLHNPGPMGPCTWGLLEKGLLPSTGCPAFGAPCVNRICAVIPP